MYNNFETDENLFAKMKYWKIKLYHLVNMRTNHKYYCKCVILPIEEYAFDDGNRQCFDNETFKEVESKYTFYCNSLKNREHLQEISPRNVSNQRNICEYCDNVIGMDDEYCNICEGKINRVVINIDDVINNKGLDHSDLLNNDKRVGNIPVPPISYKNHTNEEDKWKCSTCDFLNKMDGVECESCDTEAPLQTDDFKNGKARAHLNEVNDVTTTVDIGLERKIICNTNGNKEPNDEVRKLSGEYQSMITKESWICSQCGFCNKPEFLVCNVCYSNAPHKHYDLPKDNKEIHFNTDSKVEGTVNVGKNRTIPCKQDTQFPQPNLGDIALIKESWVCNKCSFLNNMANLDCEVCYNEAPHKNRDSNKNNETKYLNNYRDVEMTAAPKFGNHSINEHGIQFQMSDEDKVPKVDSNLNSTENAGHCISRINIILSKEELVSDKSGFDNKMGNLECEVGDGEAPNLNENKKNEDLNNIEDRWVCNKCSYFNKMAKLECGACENEAPHRKEWQINQHKFINVGNQTAKSGNLSQCWYEKCRQMIGRDKYCTFCGFDQYGERNIGSKIFRRKKMHTCVCLVWICTHCGHITDALYSKCERCANQFLERGKKMCAECKWVMSSTKRVCPKCKTG